MGAHITDSMTRRTNMKETLNVRMTLTVQEAADVLGIGRQNAYQLAGQGNLPGAFRIGRKILVSRNCLLRFIDGGFHDGN